MDYLSVWKWYIFGSFYIYIYIYIYKIVGPKELATLAHFISSPWPMPRKKKCPKMNKESPDRQDMLLRTTLSSANRDHERGKYHATEGSLLEHPNGESQCRGPPIGAWWRSNPMKSCYIYIKYTQLISWPHLCGRDP